MSPIPFDILVDIKAKVQPVSCCFGNETVKSKLTGSLVRGGKEHIMLRFIKTKRIGKQLKKLCNQSYFGDTTTADIAYVVSVVNRVIDAPVASITLLKGEEYLLGAIRAKYSDGKYRVVVR